MGAEQDQASGRASQGKSVRREDAGRGRGDVAYSGDGLLSENGVNKGAASAPQVGQTIVDRIAAHYGDLSIQLRRAADYVVAHQLDVASRSLRAVSLASDLPPPTYSRLARALGFKTYEEMRELCRQVVEQRSDSFAEKAVQLGQGDSSAGSILQRQSIAVVRNIQGVVSHLDPARLEEAADALLAARRVVVFGAYGSAGIVDYLSYLGRYSRSNWVLAGRVGASLAVELSDVAQGDVLFVVTKSPYARVAISAVQMARAQGAQTIVITDGHGCPALQAADFPFIVPSNSPQFFSSYAATLFLLEALMAVVVARDPNGTSQRIREVEVSHERLGEFCSE